MRHQISFLLAISVLVVFYCVGCVANYRDIHPEALEFQTLQDTLTDQTTYVAYRYHALIEAGNRRYAKKETRRGISLMAVQIINNGSDTLFFPDDFLVSGPTGQINMLELDQTYELLLQDKYHNKHAPIVIGQDFGNSVINSTGVGIKRKMEDKVNEYFYLELEEYYLWPCYVAPEVRMIGLIGLEVEKDTPIEFQLRN